MRDGEPAFFSRQARFAIVGSTNDVVRDWLRDGVPEVCLAVADEQSAGRGRLGRQWVAPPGAALLLSLGFRPTWLEPDRVWRLAATTSLAMADAAEEVAGLPDRAIRLKWPNDLVIPVSGPDALLVGELDPATASGRLGGPIEIRKVCGVLGETDGLGTDAATAVVGIGVNADWPADAFPPELNGSMTSLREASGGRPIDLALLLDAFTSRIEARIAALRMGRFDVGDWTDRQLTRNVDVTLQDASGDSEVVHALGVDALSGALVVEDAWAPDGERHVLSGEINGLRLAAAPAVGV